MGGRGGGNDNEQTSSSYTKKSWFSALSDSVKKKSTSTNYNEKESSSNASAKGYRQESDPPSSERICRQSLRKKPQLRKSTLKNLCKKQAKDLREEGKKDPNGADRE